MTLAESAIHAVNEVLATPEEYEWTIISVRAHQIQYRSPVRKPHPHPRLRSKTPPHRHFLIPSPFTHFTQHGQRVRGYSAFPPPRPSHRSRHILLAPLPPC